MRENKLLYLLVILSALFIVGGVYLFVPDRSELVSQKGQEIPSECGFLTETAEESFVSVLTSGEEASLKAHKETTALEEGSVSEASADSSQAETLETETASGAETLETETTSGETEAETETETETASQKTAESASSAEKKSSGTYEVSDCVFIGDSRMLFLGTSTADARYLNYLPGERIFAKFSGTVTDEYACTNVKNAAEEGALLGVFWFGINDVQLRENRDDAAAFAKDYKELVDIYVSENPESEVKIISILGTGPDEPDYYENQDANIKAYNAALKAYAEENGYTFIDLSDWSVQDAFFPDEIHFTKEWMDTHIRQFFQLLDIAY